MLLPTKAALCLLARRWCPAGKGLCERTCPGPSRLVLGETRRGCWARTRMRSEGAIPGISAVVAAGPEPRCHGPLGGQQRIRGLLQRGGGPKTGHSQPGNTAALQNLSRGPKWPRVSKLWPPFARPFVSQPHTRQVLRKPREMPGGFDSEQRRKKRVACGGQSWTEVGFRLEGDDVLAGSSPHLFPGTSRG